VYPVSSPEAAELTKLLENTFRAVNITLANEVAEAAGALGLDPVEVIDAAATKPYGFMPFYPGAGVGGHCIPCDPHYLLWQLRNERMYPAVVSAAMEGIATRPARIVQRAAEVLELGGHPLRGAAVLVVGAAYKPNVADARESPALEVITGLRRRGALVALYDPLVGGVRLDGELLLSLDDLPDMRDYDLVLVACRHDITPPEAFADAKLILDATYRLPDADNRFVP
jgi:UDP-N-acetyl-D-glucosamine dehydrogenase